MNIKVGKSKRIMASESDGNYDKSFKAKGTTYYIEMLSGAGNYVAKWWDSSDNGLGYNNKGWVAIEGKNYRALNNISDVSSDNVMDLLGVISDYDRKPGKPIQDRIKREVAKLIDFDAINSACGKKSVKANKRRGIKASRSNAPRRRMRVMAGPGAGYTIEWELERIRRVNSFDVTDVSKPDKWGTVTVTADCDVDIDVTIKSAWSYMYGFNYPIEGVSAKIHRVVFDYNISDNYGDLLNFEDYEDLTDDAEYIDEVNNAVYQINEMDAVDILEDDAWEAIKGDKFSYGGGYTHSTWDGTLLEVDDYNFAFIQVTDPSVVEYIDKSVQGETNYSTYSVFVDDDATGYAFDTEEEAIADAKEYIESGNYEGDIANTYVVRDDWFEFYDGDTDLENSEIVWNAFDEYENY